MAYLTYQDVENFLNIDLTETGQTLVNALIEAVESVAEDFCNRTWAVTGDQTETFDGGSDTFFVKHPPIAAITSVIDNGETVTSDDYYQYDSYVRLTYRPSPTPQRIQIVYSSGVSLPDSVKHALVRWVSEIYNAAAEGGKTAKRQRVGEVEVEYVVSQATSGAMPDFVKTVLSLHRKMPV